MANEDILIHVKVWIVCRNSVNTHTLLVQAHFILWVCPNYSNTYCVVRQDRNRHGGGVLHDVIRASLEYNVLPVSDNQLEFWPISVNDHCSHCKHTVCFLYRPPGSSPTVLRELQSVLECCNPSLFSSSVLIGDFNVNFLDITHPGFSFVSDILCSFNLTQVCPGPTHIATNGSCTMISFTLIRTMLCSDDSSSFK